MTDKKTSDYINSPLQKTPIADLCHVYLETPDVYKDLVSGKCADPKYCVTLILDTKRPDHAAYLKALNDLNDAVGKELMANLPKVGSKAYRVKDIARAEEDDDGNPTGRYFLKATSKTKRQVLDSTGKAAVPAHVLTKAGNGSTGRVIMSLKKSIASQQKTVGLTLYLDKAQLITIVERTGGTGGTGFDSVDGGFTAEPTFDDGSNF